MKILKQRKSLFLRILLFSAAIFFIFSSFSTKISIINFSKLIEVFNGDFYSNLSKKEVQGYNFFYDTASSEENINEIIDIVENQGKLPIELLNIKKIEKPKVKVLSKFNKRYSESLGYVYFHNNIITILNKESLAKGSNYNIDKRFVELISHEYTHFLINSKLKESSLFPKAIPLWFNEGIAEYVGVSSRLGYIPDRFKTKTKLSELNDIFDEDPDLFYDQSVVFINYLIKNYGYISISEIFQHLKNNTFDKSIKIVTGESLNEISLKLFNLPYN